MDDTGWRVVDLPHDWSIELERDPASPSGSAGGYFPAGVGWYQKRFSVPAEWKGKTECRDGYITQDCKNAPKATPTPTAAATQPPSNGQ